MLSWCSALHGAQEDLEGSSLIGKRKLTGFCLKASQFWVSFCMVSLCKWGTELKGINRFSSFLTARLEMQAMEI